MKAGFPKVGGLAKEIESFCPASSMEWREWLQEHHLSKQSIWLVYHKQSTNIPSLRWSEAVEEALCFGWIDSTIKSIDEKKYIQYFSRRKPSSTWSRVNKEKVEQLIQGNRMTKAGFESITKAKENGTWSWMDDIENLILPEELRIALNADKKAVEYFEAQSKSVKKRMLHWVVTAKRAETRKKRIKEVVQSAAKRTKPKSLSLSWGKEVE
ncbi:omdA super family protein [Perkinsela sp. CCAP 1560/4]|nr:omdA super family protein [Perkinsela sp. CCAP 1560/4]|eukprot:KNH04946.1 omdA super family protein [Perkinsela sp. CCAP 1560/4]